MKRRFSRSFVRLFEFFKKNYLILLLFILALSIRAWGVYPGFPDNHADENLGYGTAVYMFYHHFTPDSFDYGTGRPFILLVLFRMFFLPVVAFQLFFFQQNVFLQMIMKGADNLPQYQNFLFGPHMINALYWSRYIGALVGALCVPLIFLTGKKLFNKRVGLIAAIFLIFNYRHVLNSMVGLPDIFNSFFYVLTFFSAVLLFEKNDKKRYIFAGIIAGFAFSIKYQFFPLLPVFFVHAIWAYRKKSFSYLFNKYVILSGAIFIIVFILVNPYLFSNLPQFLDESRRNYLRYKMGSLGLRTYPYFYLFHWGVGELASLAVLLGAFLMLLSRRLIFFLLMIAVFPFFFFMTYFSIGGFYTRNFTTVIPLLFIFAGYLFDFLYKKFKNKAFGVIILAILLILVNFMPIRNSFLLGYSYSKQWNSDVLMNWIEKNLPANVSIFSYPLNVSANKRDVLAEIVQKRHISWSDWSYDTDSSSLTELQEEFADFAIVNISDLQNATYWWRMWTDSSLFLKYDNVPFDYIENDFFGLTIKELRKYTVHEVYKPWQAQSARNYLVFKIPQKPKEIGRKILLFDFSDKKDSWKKIGIIGEPQMIGGWIGSVGKTENGTLFISDGPDTTEKLVSAPIEIAPNKFYTVKGWLKSEYNGENNERDGFIRLDFYKNQKDAEKAVLGESVAVSSRALNTGEWNQKQASFFVPKGISHMTISFQRRSFSSVKSGLNPIYLDDVEVYEADSEPEETFKEIPYIKSTIPLESVYYNSFF